MFVMCPIFTETRLRSGKKKIKERETFPTFGASLGCRKTAWGGWPSIQRRPASAVSFDTSGPWWSPGPEPLQLQILNQPDSPYYTPHISWKRLRTDLILLVHAWLKMCALRVFRLTQGFGNSNLQQWERFYTRASQMIPWLWRSRISTVHYLHAFCNRLFYRV